MRCEVEAMVQCWFAVVILHSRVTCAVGVADHILAVHSSEDVRTANHCVGDRSDVKMLVMIEMLVSTEMELVNSVEVG